MKKREKNTKKINTNYKIYTKKKHIKKLKKVYKKIYHMMVDEKINNALHEFLINNSREDGAKKEKKEGEIRVLAEREEKQRVGIGSRMKLSRL